MLFILALLPRLIGLGEATTEDEDQWIARSGGFARALTTGAWRETFLIGHPGVTTMWVTVLSLGPERARQLDPRERGNQLVTLSSDFLPALHAARWSFAILNAGLVALCGVLAARLFGRWPGLSGGLLLALDPYWSAMSSVVGMDGLLAGLVGASLLSAVLAFGRPSASPAYALGSGLLAGLALLTKAPAVFLFPIVGLVAVLGTWRPTGGRVGEWESGRVGELSAPALPLSRSLTTTASKLALWVGGLLAALATWPALWVDPLGTLGRAARFVRETGGTPHAPGNFLLGQPAVDPGPLFYPVALGLRLGPAVLLGLLALLWVGLPRRWRRPVGVLLAFAFLFSLGLTLSPKKVDRYLLPLVPVLGLLAGLGWWLAVRSLRSLVSGLRRTDQRPETSDLRLTMGVAGAVLAALLQVWPLIGAWPHPLAAYNPLVGGARVAELSIPVGWGEALDTVGDYLRRQPNPERLTTAIWYPLYANFQAHAPGRVTNLDFSGPGQLSARGQQLYDQADFYVDYVHARQRRLTPRPLLTRRPDFVATINGVEYARVYRLR